MIAFLLRSQIFWGIVLIAAGLVRGKSVFLGDFGVFAIVCDAVGVFAIIRGLARMIGASRDAAAQPTGAAAPPGRPR